MKHNKLKDGTTNDICNARNKLVNTVCVHLFADLFSSREVSFLSAVNVNATNRCFGYNHVVIFVMIFM